ncbi:MAG: phosphoribosylamine--glycine ligase [Myxococcales bacterium]|nr:phosphoribosylamine--glycine ligase [Myxococcales bacterium]
MLGSGGREHALAWALGRSASVAEVLVAPGNAGMPRAAASGVAAVRNVAVLRLDDPEAIVSLARASEVDLVVVGPEGPLCAGVVDALEDAGVAAFGPRMAAARLEGSKAFMKEFAEKHGILTAPFLVTSSLAEAERFIDERHALGRDVVVKTDGLAAGKGAIVTSSAVEAKLAARAMLVDGAFGAAGWTIVVEDRLPGSELSVLAVSDGERVLVLPVARDHKRLGDGDSGPNTGGMGAVAPVAVEPSLLARIEREVLMPTVRGLAAMGVPYRGVLFAGIMVLPDGTPYLLEHNVRFGDPETQAILPLIEGDLCELFMSAARGKLEADCVRVVEGRSALVVVLAAHGYPENARKGDVIHGLEGAAEVEGVTVYHAGTAYRAGTVPPGGTACPADAVAPAGTVQPAGTGRHGDEVMTAGGRVLGVGAIGNSLAEARARAYEAAGRIDFSGMQVRSDIAASS